MTIGAEHKLHCMMIAAERCRLVGTAVTGQRRLATAERAIAATRQRRRGTTAAESGRRTGMPTIATAETAESVARPNVATAVDSMRSSLLPAARPGSLPSRGEGRATSRSGGARLW